MDIFGTLGMKGIILYYTEMAAPIQCKSIQQQLLVGGTMENAGESKFGCDMYDVTTK